MEITIDDKLLSNGQSLVITIEDPIKSYSEEVFRYTIPKNRGKGMKDWEMCIKKIVVEEPNETK